MVIIVLLLYHYVKREPIHSWDCPRMIALKKEWLSLWGENRSTSWDEERWGFNNDKFYKMLYAILENGLSDNDIHGLVEVIEELPVCSHDQCGFHKSVLSYMIMRFIQSGDRERLVKLLSKRFPDQLGFSGVPIEYGLVLWGEEMNNPILILGEAYKKCEEPQVRHHIAIVIRRAFLGSGIKEKDDDEFVSNAMQWYSEEKDNLVLNLHYAGIPPSPISYDDFPEAYEKVPNLDRPETIDRARVWARYKKNPLFVEKSSEDKPNEPD